MNNPTSSNAHVNNSMSQKRSKYKLPGVFKKYKYNYKYKCLQDSVYPRSTGIQSAGPNIGQTGPARKCANRADSTFVCSVPWISQTLCFLASN